MKLYGELVSFMLSWLLYFIRCINSENEVKQPHVSIISMANAAAAGINSSGASHIYMEKRFHGIKISA